jgi:two-component system CheB/CheR fusion protein
VPFRKKPKISPPVTRYKPMTHVVGIGASAGGLEALEHFLSNVPPSSGLAFVVVQHLDPTHKGMLPELLQRVTPMKVVEATNRMPIEPDCVYVIPPNKELSVLHGALHLLDTAAPRGLHLPIDFFFRALANDQHENAIGVILSGMGSDGTAGLMAIKEQAGLVLVQSPEDARFDSMPRSAIDAGLADIIGAAEDLPSLLFTHLKLALAFRSQADGKTFLMPQFKEAVEQIIILLRDRTGNDLSLYKRKTVYSRVERRMGLHKIEAPADYVRFLRESPQEIDLLFKELLIGVTQFFRDSEVWDKLRTDILPALLQENPAGRDFRAWVPACSTGEEAYSLAILFREVLRELQPTGRFALQIFATDLDHDAIEKARLGVYPPNIAADVPAEWLDRYFSLGDHGAYRVRKDIREMVIFAPQNAIMDPPFTRLDILSCRNLLIYLGPELQARLLRLFHYALSPRGLLVLGNSESLGDQTELFKPVASKDHIYVRQEHSAARTMVDLPFRFFSVAGSTMQEPSHECYGMSIPAMQFQASADQFLLQHCAPAAVLINAEGDILYINGRTGPFLEPASGKANWNIHVMVREGLRYELAIAIKKAQSQPSNPVCLQGLPLEEGGGHQQANLTVWGITQPDCLSGLLMVTFELLTSPAKKRRSRGADQAELKEQLELSRQHIRSLQEDMQIKQEELSSTIEELQSTNEELQSANEELTTAKEEMQSLNEEMQTINAELQSKLDYLSEVNNDMNNLLESTELATVFLDAALNVRRFTSPCTRLFKLKSADTGRPLSDIVTDLQYPELQQDAHEVLRTLVFREKEVTTLNGHWFRVRIMPYRTQNNVIDGVVITFMDISESKKLEAELRKSQNGE